MHLRFCSFTGADDAVDPADLARLSREYPFAEWALLCSPADQGNPRVPTQAWIDNFKQVCRDAHAGLHLCDAALPALIAGEAWLTGLMRGFGRIQLNLEYKDAGAAIDPVRLAARVRELPAWEFILQYGRKYGHFITAFDAVPNHAVLFDGSAGEGILPDEWPKPLAGRACGYAGGLAPDNMEKNLRAIARAVPAGYPTWVDQETGARTGNRFDLDKVRRVLEIAAPYAQGTRP